MLKQGDRFGRLVVNSISLVKKTKRLHECTCDCGNIIICSANNLKTGNTKSCGCYKSQMVKEAKTTHGMRYSKEYQSWRGMKSRCYNKKNKHFKDYGGRGITVCDEWLSGFSAFFDDMGRCPGNYTIDRINVNGGYGKSNCRWASDTEQARNQRIRKDNKTGCKGVCFDKESGKYRAGITVNKKQIYLGRHADMEGAISARKIAEDTYWT